MHVCVTVTAMSYLTSKIYLFIDALKITCSKPTLRSTKHTEFEDWDRNQM